MLAECLWGVVLLRWSGFHSPLFTLPGTLYGCPVNWAIPILGSIMNLQDQQDLCDRVPCVLSDWPNILWKFSGENGRTYLSHQYTCTNSIITWVQQYTLECTLGVLIIDKRPLDVGSGNARAWTRVAGINVYNNERKLVVQYVGFDNNGGVKSKKTSV